MHRLRCLRGIEIEVWLVNMNIQQFRKKHTKEDIVEYIHRIAHGIFRAEDVREEEFLNDLYYLLIELFPDCDPYKQGLNGE